MDEWTITIFHDSVLEMVPVLSQLLQMGKRGISFPPAGLLELALWLDLPFQSEFQVD